MSSRTEVFQRLKPLCIQLSQHALALAGKSTDIKALISSLEYLLQELNAVRNGAGDIDAKLAEYVFFPLSHVLKASRIIPGRALELTLECLHILLVTGWERNIPKDLGIQLLILLSFLGDTSNTTAKLHASSEELQTVALKSLAALLGSFSRSPNAKDSLIATENILSIGNCMSLSLDAIVVGRSSDIQLAAAQAVLNFLTAVEQQDVLANFLPGIISSLSRVLSSTVQTKRSFKVLQSCLESLANILLLVFSDVHTANLPQKSSDGRGSILTPAWLSASAGQIKQALSNIITVRQHERREVRDGLARLCIIVLEDCRKSLEGCSTMMMDTLVSLIDPETNNVAGAYLQRLIGSHPEAAEHLKTVVHGWVVSLPRLMSSQNDRSKRDVLQRISAGFKLLHQEAITVATFDSSLASSLRDSVTVLVRGQSRTFQESNPDFPELIGQVTTTTTLSGSVAQFRPVLGRVGEQIQGMLELRQLLAQIGRSDPSLGLTFNLLETAHNAQGEVKLASFWLAKVLIDTIFSTPPEISDLLEFDDDVPPALIEARENIYALAVSIVTESIGETDMDWRLRALALETIASQANDQGPAYRPELIDTLYPILHLMGSSNDRLRHHALTCMNIVARACQYNQASDMIVQNVDYLVNAVGLSLNSFELSPEAPQVLLMMVRLSGPSLLPYLEDLVSSMFSALESFHGYPRLVELLFSVFRAMSEEGVKTQALSIDGSCKKASSGIQYNPPTTLDIVETMRDLCDHLTRSREDEEKPEPFPQGAWKNDKENDETGIDEQGEQNPSLQNEDAQPPVPKSYNLLLKIAKLTQHYLPSSSPSLRVSLLSLLRTTFPALAAHENSFLPLINTLWPVLVPRLLDPEAFIVASTLDVIGLMCLHGGNFMKSRIDDVWPSLMSLDPRKEIAKNRSLRSKAGDSDRDIQQLLGNVARDEASKIVTTELDSTLRLGYVDSPSRMIWKSYVDLLISIVGNVAIDDEKYDEALDLMQPLLHAKRDIRDVFESRNPDAVWLRLHYAQNPSSDTYQSVVR
ncbi:ARM repeat-containing protein [Pseudovirgaria hyperparasitica]|uniref:ARM repeat-containing protein n=1 Tax=Pseudovirgaria hyperparasitica TaxID=470096 RepID=A0A6A6WMF5_9PEZI|nr:ARM repeat-containing protein [Pseudovirgaria hyperparasitica]KAF2763391.1 ARM repeat-containing protein [Pseudovirgaria hyperparasitica]